MTAQKGAGFPNRSTTDVVAGNLFGPPHDVTELLSIPEDGQSVDGLLIEHRELRPHMEFFLEWRAFIQRMEDGDELRQFVSPEASWRHCAGRAGYARVREGKVVETLITLMN